MNQFSRIISPATGMEFPPPLPQVRMSVDDVPGLAAAEASRAETFARCEALRESLKGFQSEVDKLSARRTDLVRIAARGDTIKPGEAVRIDKERAAVEAQAAVVEEALVEAEARAKQAASTVLRILREAAGRYARRITVELQEARTRMVIIKQEFEARSAWADEANRRAEHSAGVAELRVLLGLPRE